MCLTKFDKIGMVQALLYRCFRICSDWTMFRLELVKLVGIFKINGYTDNFINNYFKMFLDNKHRIQGKVITVPKKPLFLPFLTLDHYRCKL